MKKFLNKYPLFSRLFVFILMPVVMCLLGGGLYLKYQLDQNYLDQEVFYQSNRIAITWNEKGIPSVIADNDTSAYFGLGIVHARDRLWQIDQWRNMAKGNLSSILGESYIPSDRFYKNINLQGMADLAWRNLDDDVKAKLEAYSSGINAVLDNSSESLMLVYQGRKYDAWCPRDTLAIYYLFAWANSHGLQESLMAAATNRSLGAYADPAIREDAFGTVLNLLQGKAHLFSWISEPSMLRESWAVAVIDKSTNSTSVTHTSLGTSESLHSWYAANMTGDQFTVSGMTLPGVPVFFDGNNKSISWSLIPTNDPSQKIDFHELNPVNPGQYVSQNRYVDFVVETHFINPLSSQFDLSSQQKVYVRNTLSGPLISDAIPYLGAANYSVEWAGFDDKGESFTNLFALPIAQNWQQFTELFSDYLIPAAKVAYADGQGNIGALAVGSRYTRQNVASETNGGQAYAMLKHNAGAEVLSFNSSDAIVSISSFGNEHERLINTQVSAQSFLNVKLLNDLNLDVPLPEVNIVADVAYLLAQSIPADDNKDELIARLLNWNGSPSSDPALFSFMTTWIGWYMEELEYYFRNVSSVPPWNSSPITLGFDNWPLAKRLLSPKAAISHCMDKGEQRDICLTMAVSALNKTIGQLNLTDAPLPVYTAQTPYSDERQATPGNSICLYPLRGDRKNQNYELMSEQPVLAVRQSMLSGRGAFETDIAGQSENWLSKHHYSYSNHVCNEQGNSRD